jgi:hypothetical protein
VGTFGRVTPDLLAVPRSPFHLIPPAAPSHAWSCSIPTRTHVVGHSCPAPQLPSPWELLLLTGPVLPHSSQCQSLNQPQNTAPRLHPAEKPRLFQDQRRYLSKHSRRATDRMLSTTDRTRTSTAPMESSWHTLPNKRQILTFVF